MSAEPVAEERLIVDLRDSSYEAIAWALSQLPAARRAGIINLIDRLNGVAERLEGFSLAGVAGKPCYADTRRLGTIIKATDDGFVITLEVHVSGRPKRPR